MEAKKSKYVFFIAILVSVLFNIIIKLEFVKVLIDLDKLFMENMKSLESGFYLKTLLIFPVIEEFIFRFLVYKNFKKIINYKLANFFTSIFFALYHFNLTQGIYSFVLSIIITHFYELTDKIYLVIILHIGVNFISILINSSLTSIFTSEIVYLSSFLVFLAIIFMIKKLSFLSGRKK